MNSIDKIIRESIDNIINEGIDFDPMTRTVAYIPNHEDNQTADNNIVDGLTIIIPSGNELNTHIAEVVMSKSENAKLIQGVIRKMTTEEVNDIVMEDESKFREYYGNNFNAAYYQLLDYLEKMNNERNGTFSRHFIKDPNMRNILDMTLKVSEDSYARFANTINGQHVLLIDDTISRGQTINNACNILMESYAPKSITVLTLLSRLN